tara:strand:- start:54 stop:263 length:210 start_codon:yes stop_codon:yes gene_type:complete
MSKDLKVNMKLFSFNNQIILNNNYANKVNNNSNITFGLNNKTNRKPCAKLMVQGNKNCVSCNSKGIKVK